LIEEDLEFEGDEFKTGFNDLALSQNKEPKESEDLDGYDSLKSMA